MVLLALLITVQKMTTKEAFIRFIACSDIDILERETNTESEREKKLFLKNYEKYFVCGLLHFGGGNMSVGARS
jgi:hypothetical protein